MNTRRFALVLSKLMLACCTTLPAIALAQVPTDRFAWVTLVDYWNRGCSTYCFDYRSAGIAVQAFGYQIMLTQDPADRAPSWSPDGTRIAFQRAGEIMVINATTGGTPANITNHPATDGLPAWSPDGTRIAFLSDRDGQSSQPYLMNVDGSGVVRLTNGIPVRGRIAWSPNGAKIAFDCEVDPGNFDICSINTDGTGFARLTTDPSYDFGPAWSPDGSRIAFSTSRFGGVCEWPSDDPYAFVDPNELAIVNADGTGFSRVGPAGTPGSGPSWSPDGNRIVFAMAQYYDCRWVTYHIVQINTDGTLLTGMASGFDVAWGPAIATPSGPAVALLPLSLSFPIQSVGTTSSPQTIRLINYGSGALAISGIVASGDFAQVNTCSGTVAPGAECTINVRFTPTGSGTRSGAVTIMDNAPGPHVVALSGVGNFPPIASFTSNCIAMTCTFDGSASADPDGGFGSVWDFGDGSGLFGGVVVTHTYAASGTYSVTLTVTDNAGVTGTQSKSVTVPAGFMHVGDLDGTRANQQNTWTATVTVTVEDSGHNRLANATVNGSWTNGGTSSCMTNVSGQCAVSNSGIPNRTGSATFTVSGVTHTLLPYKSTDNHDPDGDSTGTSITVNRR